MTFIILSIIGLLIASFDAFLPFYVLFILLFVVSYLKIKDANSPGVWTYIFILIAPGVIDGVSFLLVPEFGVFSGFIRIFLSYYYLVDKEFLD